MNVPRLFLSNLFVGLMCAGMALAEKPAPMDPDEWEAEMKKVSEVQREAMNLSNRIKQIEAQLLPLEEEPEEGPKAQLEELQNKRKALFLQSAKRMAELSQLTDDARLSALATLRAGQNYMRADAFETATTHFDKLAIDEELEADLRAQALYWTALCHERMELLNDAKRLYKAITAEFRESKWAKYARGRLTDPAFQ